MKFSLLSPQGAAMLGFFMVVGATVVGALIAVAARNIFHNVLGLALSLIGVAGLFLYLNSPFVALMEILIYVFAAVQHGPLGLMVIEFPGGCFLP